jgi:CreA protein
MTLCAIAIIVLSATVDSFVVPTKRVNHASQYRTYLNTKHSSDAVEHSARYPRQFKVMQLNEILSSGVGIVLGLITLMAPLNLPFTSSTSNIANAADSKIVGSFSGSGLFFKDTLQVESFDDPKVQGVKLYVSNFILPINERLSSTKNLFSDPSSASLTCAKTGPIKIADTIVKGTGGEQVFEESKSLLFKSLKVQRVYDEEDKTLIYVSYNTRLDKNDDSNKSRFKSSLCAIGIE